MAHDKQLNFTLEQGAEILKVVALLSNAGVLKWKKTHPVELDKTKTAPLGAELDLRIFIGCDGAPNPDGSSEHGPHCMSWELVVYSEHGGDCASFPIPDDVEFDWFEDVGETLDRPSPRVLKNAELSAIAQRLYPETYARQEEMGRAAARALKQ